MSTIAGRAKVIIGADTKQLTTALGAAKKQIQGFATSIRDIGMALGGAGLAIAAPLLGAVKVASDMQEAMSKFDTVFAENSAAVRDWANNYSAAVGRSELQTVKFLASLQDLFVPLGFAAKEAIGLSKQVATLATDLASFNNTTDDAALRDLQAAITGSGEVMKKYGVVLTEAAVKQELLNMAINPKIATNQQKVLARLNIIMRGTTAAQGDALKTAGSFANRMKALSASFENLAVTVGDVFLPYATKFVDLLVKAAGKIKGFVDANKSLLLTVGKIAVVMITAGGALFGLGAGILIAIKTWGLLIGAVIAAKAAFFGILGVVAALASPLGLIIGLAGVLVYLFSDKIGAAFKAAAASTEPIINSLRLLKAVFSDIIETLSSGDIAMAFAMFKSVAKIAIKEVQAQWEIFTSAITGVWNEAINLIIKAWDTVQEIIVMGINSLMQIIQKMGAAVGIDFGISDLSDQIEKEFKKRDQEREKDLQASANASAERIAQIENEIAAEKRALDEMRKRAKDQRAEAQKAAKAGATGGLQESEKDYQALTHSASIGGFSQRGISAQAGLEKKLIDVNERTAKATEKIAVLMERGGSFAFI